MIETLSTYHIHINGLVQGVGFRPHVFRIATLYQVHGWVNNNNSGVHMVFNATPEKAYKLYNELIASAPPLSRIIEHSISRIETQTFSAFEIVDSNEGPVENLMLAPDYAICDDCRTELSTVGNRRFQYPFITCTSCGPRYSITRQLPYDRVNTSMSAFEMCEACSQEYGDPADRRHYSQTNSCDGCGIQLAAYLSNGGQINGDSKLIIEKVVEALRNQQIVAVKGIGGYLLLCDATNGATVQALRTRKHRPSKPFALLYPDIDSVKKQYFLSPEEEMALKSSAAPIVLLQRRLTAVEETELASDAVARGLLQFGVMLPYAPILHLIATSMNKPLIATSANISDSPIIYDNADALAKLSSVADLIVTNNREIVTPQDDSVVRFSAVKMQKTILRRSRGMAPSYFGYQTRSKKTILATGASLKTSFTYTNQGNVYVSQYLGNTDGYDAQLSYWKTLDYFINVLQKQPKVVVADKHPQYFSTQVAIDVSEEFHCPLIQVQHHKAHAAAVLAENGLLHADEPILAVVWDGTGLGDDGNIWGGEFFEYSNNALIRYSHFDYFPSLLGDKMAKEPRLSALSVCCGMGMADDILQSKFTDKEWALYRRLARRDGHLQSSSVGRLFDALASLLGVCDRQTYEGEAALLIETMARRYFSMYGYGFSECYFMPGEQSRSVSTEVLFSGVVKDIKEGRLIDFIAAKFHYSLVVLVISMAESMAVGKIVFSGGVFQNTVLIDLLHWHVGDRLELYFHKELPSNDENLSFGQMVYYDNDIDGCCSALVDRAYLEAMK